jgi:hypothetical protein
VDQTALHRVAQNSSTHRQLTIAVDDEDRLTWSGWIHDDAGRGERAWRVVLDAWTDVCPIEQVEPKRRRLAALAAAYHTVSYADIVTRLEPLRRSDIAGGLDLYFRILDLSVR